VSSRVSDALQAIKVRRDRHRRRLYPLRLVVIAVVVATGVAGEPSPGLRGRGLGVTIMLVVFALGVVYQPPRQGRGWQALTVTDLLCVGSAGVALAALQPQAASELPASAAVFMAAISLPPRAVAAVAVPVTVGLGIAIGQVSDAQTVTASVLFCGVLVVVGALVRNSWNSEDRTELLLAELQEARDDQARLATAAERARIAGELHDVLAHSLSGLSIQLEGARKLASNEGSSDELRSVLNRSSALAKEGLVEARRAVSALRDEDLTTIERLPELLERCQRDLSLSVSLAVEGVARPVPAEVDLTLYQAVGEALTNVSRHAPGAAACVLVEWMPTEVHLRVVDQGGATGSPAVDGGGWGLFGMRQRVARLGGRVVAGPDGSGWSVDIVVPA
jgi:signal transduction histidine kinase